MNHRGAQDSSQILSAFFVEPLRTRRTQRKTEKAGHKKAQEDAKNADLKLLIMGINRQSLAAAFRDSLCSKILLWLSKSPFVSLVFLVVKPSSFAPPRFCVIILCLAIRQAPAVPPCEIQSARSPIAARSSRMYPSFPACRKSLGRSLSDFRGGRWPLLHLERMFFRKTAEN